VSKSGIRVDLRTGLLEGGPLAETVRTVGDLAGLFLDEGARRAMDPARVVYRVQCFFPVKEGEAGGLFWGSTCIEPGRVGDEYFMTKGHFHATRARGEYYVTVNGEGALILMDEGRRTWMEVMRPGSVHYIAGSTAHRVANTGASVLSFLACWPSDAGHDYDTITRHGFGARLRDVGGRPALVLEAGS
jgi:glucose-6-phosphate isomerase